MAALVSFVPINEFPDIALKMSLYKLRITQNTSQSVNLEMRRGYLSLLAIAHIFSVITNRWSVDFILNLVFFGVIIWNKSYPASFVETHLPECDEKVLLVKMVKSISLSSV